MATVFPCPNPSCTYQFPPSAVRGTGALTCPRCGTVFQFRAPASPAAGIPLARPVGPAAGTPVPRAVPLARPVGPVAQPVPVAVPGPPPLPASEPGPVLVTSPLAERGLSVRKTGPLGRALPLLVLAGLLAAGAAGLVWWWPAILRELAVRPADVPPEGEVNEFPNLNFRFTLPEKPWKQDVGEVRQALRAQVVLRRTDPEAWLAVAARDFKKQTPRLDEIREEAARRLESYFADSLETEPGGEVVLGGRPAQRLVFRGNVEDVVVSGECYLLVHQGIAYWFFTWAPAGAVRTAEKEFDDLRQRFALLRDNRPEYTARPQAQTFRGHNVACTLQDEAGLWKEWVPATHHDPTADLALCVKEQRLTRDNKGLTDIVATVLLLVPKEPQDSLASAVKAARAHVTERLNEQGLPTTLEEVAEKGADQPGPIGKEQGQLVKLHAKLGETLERFVLLGVIHKPGRVLILDCECDWRRRSDWEPRFLQLLSTFALDGP